MHGCSCGLGGQKGDEEGGVLEQSCIAALNLRLGVIKLRKRAVGRQVRICTASLPSVWCDLCFLASHPDGRSPFLTTILNTKKSLFAATSCCSLLCSQISQVQAYFCE